MNTYVFNMGGPVGTVEFYEDDLKSIIWEKDEDDCWVSYDPIPCVSEPEDPEVYVYDFRVCGDDLFVGGAYVKSIYSTNGRWKRIEDWKKLLDVPEDMEESRRPRGRMLKEYVDEMPIPYLIGQAKFEDGWSPMVVSLNWNNDRYWYEASAIDAGGVYFTELGRGFVVSKVKPGTDKCDPKEVYAVKRHFFDGCEDQGLPVREVKTVRELGRCAPAGRELHSRD